MSDCVFCRIINKELPSQVVYEDDLVLAIKDIQPQAPVHVLVMPKKHIENILELNNEDSEISNAIINAISNVAKEAGVDDRGFRVINNCGKDGGQTVMHVHFHVIGGSELGERII